MRVALLFPFSLAFGVAGCSSTPEVLVHDHFDDATLWKVGPTSDPLTTCGAGEVDGAPGFALALDEPQNRPAPACLGTRLDGFDLSSADEAWLEVSYDVSRFDLGGDLDEADLLVSVQSGHTEVQALRSWRGDYDDGPLTGSIDLDLGRLAGLDEPVRIVLGFRLFACPDITSADCGVGSGGPVPVVRFEDLLLQAIPIRHAE